LQRSGIDWSESYIMIYIIYNLDYHLIRWYIYIHIIYVMIHPAQVIKIGVESYVETPRTEWV
jgi:hypothetical protein